MDLRPELQLKAAIKALTDVVLPAVDPNNKLAQEQGHLAVGMLSIALERLPLLYRYDRDELKRQLALAARLQALTAGTPGAEAERAALADGAAQGSELLDRAGAEPGALEASNGDLRARIGALVTALYAGNDPATLKDVSAVLLASGREQLLRERAWLIGQGWEPDPAAVPSIESLLER